MRDKASLHSVPIVPDLNFAGDPPGYADRWTVPSFEDLYRSRRPVYVPPPAPKWIEKSPWFYRRNEAPLRPESPSPVSQGVSSRSFQMMAPALAAKLQPTDGLAAKGGSGQMDAMAARAAGPAVLFGLGTSSQPQVSGAQIGSGGLLDLLTRLMAANPGDRSSSR